MKKIFYLSLLVFCFTACNKPVDLKVLSFNIRLDAAVDSLNNWQYRKDVAAKIVVNENADIFGTQEVLMNQLKDLKERLPEYSAIGVGRTDGKEKGEYCAVFYKKNRFKEVESGNFWLSETPDVPGVKGWDAACERVATWAILEDIDSKKQLFFINTHLDHMGQVARQEGVTLLLEKAATYSKGLPVIMTGDFNAEPESDVIKHVLDTSNPNYLVHTKDIAETKSGEKGTFHNYGRIPVEKRVFIDYIFVSPSIKVKSHSVVPEKLDDVYISDHAIVSAEISF
ncbi:endonuclease/exonuclease/phosphatase family protein [Dysgonomonas sp. Marseille-P4361]|uniref:endonuclease/exonuclease/phosphatase family protein n=1 Tax=Dysgonomonas sp. Marseille-P4361 TaxID=2161820 RepID=UPI000D54E112|nr:endonuclease/exonuclease/phosphatase family protein [Dysgonomonas sp. Marseille-P4361]